MVTLALALLLGAPSPSADLAVRLETRGSRLAPEGAVSPESRFSAELTPTVGMALDDRTWLLRGAYVPRLWSPDLENGRVHVDHQVQVRTEVRPGPSFHMGLTAFGVRGVLNPLADAWTDFSNTPINAVTGTQSYQTARLALDTFVQFGPRTTVAFLASVATSSGTDQASRVALPPQHTLVSNLLLERAFSARDRAGLALEGTIARTEPAGPNAESGFVSAGLRWERRLSPHLRGWAQAGAAFVRESSQVTEPVTGYAPGGELGLAREPDRSGLSGAADLRLAPDIDRATGRARRGLNGALTGTWQASSRWAWNAGLNSFLALPDADGTAFAAGTKHDYIWEPLAWSTELRLLHTLETGLTVEVGARMRWQKDRRTLQGTFSEAGVFVALDWTLARARAARTAPAALP